MFTAEITEEITFSGGTLFGLFLSGAFSAVLPIALMICWRRRTHASLFPVLVGFLTYFFVSWIRAGFRAVLFTDELKQTAWAFYLVSALLSGVLEESGRYTSMRFIMKDDYDDWRDAVSYGIGHGGCELIWGSASQAFGFFLRGLECNRLGAAALIKADTIEGSAKKLEDLQRLSEHGAWETVGAIGNALCGAAFHIAMSVLVLAAVHYIGQKKYLFIAMGLHTAGNFLVWAISVVPALAVLCIVPDPGIFVTVPICLYVRFVYRRLTKEQQPWLQE
ncbi:MAG: YhfC family intramembrane metalloprotease [Ruminococcus sp.]|nr:YhfC family intramembrane metalloprotease [Ruminococcus sp.]